MCQLDTGAALRSSHNRMHTNLQPFELTFELAAQEDDAASCNVHFGALHRVLHRRFGVSGVAAGTQFLDAKGSRNRRLLPNLPVISSRRASHVRSRLQLHDVAGRGRDAPNAARHSTCRTAPLDIS